MGCWLVLLDMVPLHDFSLFVQTEVPAPARLLLPIYHGGVCHIIVLEHRLLEFALWRKVFLWGERRGRETSRYGVKWLSDSSSQGTRRL